MEVVNLKKIVTKIVNNYFVVIGITKQKYEEILKHKDFLYEKDDSFNEFIDSFDRFIKSKIEKEEYVNDKRTILFIGDLNKYPFVSSIVYKYKKKANGGKPIYRNYCSTKEQQAKTQLFVNVAEDADTCWNTVKSALGAKSTSQVCYGIIARFSNIKEEEYYDSLAEVEDLMVKLKN